MEEKRTNGYLYRSEKLRELNDKMLQGIGDTEIARYLLANDSFIKNRFEGYVKKKAIDTLRKVIKTYRDNLFDSPDAPKYATEAYIQRYSGKIDYINMIDKNIALLQERIFMRHSLDRKVGIPSKGVLDDMRVVAKLMTTSVELKERIGLLNPPVKEKEHTPMSNERYEELKRMLSLCADPAKTIEQLTGVPAF